MFVSFSYHRFDCRINVILLYYLHGPSVVSSILFKSAFMDLKLSDKAMVSSYSRHLAGASVSFGHISNPFFIIPPLTEIANYSMKYFILSKV